MPENDKKNNILSFLIRIGLSALCLWVVFLIIDVEKAKAVLSSANIGIIGFACVFFIALNFILLIRWNLFIKALGISAPFLKVVRFFGIGLFGNLFLPSAIGGDIIKIVGLCKNSDQKPRVVASVLLDRLSGFASIVLVAVVAFAFGYHLFDDKVIFIPILFMALGSAVAACILFNEKIYSFFCKVFNKFPKIKDAVMQMHYDIMLLGDQKRVGVWAVLLSCVSQTSLAICWFFIAKGLGQDISLIYFLIFVPITCVASSVPSIGGLGVREAGAAYLFAQIGVEPEIAVSISLISYLYMVIVGLLGGLFYVFTLSSGRVQHNTSDAGGAAAKA